MIFFLILFIAVFLYLIGKYFSSLLLFFFFLSNGFQIIPLDLFQTPIDINKPIDFALLYVLILFPYAIFKVPKTVLKGRIAKSIFLFLGFVLVCVFVNGFLWDISWDEIIRTSRYFFIILSYFLFVKLPVHTINKIFRVLFVIILMQSVLFILQILLGRVLLTGYIGELVYMEEIGFKRFRNLIPLLPYFVFYALFKNPYKRAKKSISICLTILGLLLSMFRGMVISLSLTALFGSYLYSGRKGIVKTIVIALICLMPFTGILLARFETSNTINDVKLVLSGSDVYKNYSVSDNATRDATLLFRFAHFHERLLYVLEKPSSMLFGVGLMTEDSQTTQKLNFQIGLKNNYGITQLDTGDIAWSSLIVRFGIVGTIVYLIFFYALLSFFWKRRKTKEYLHSLLYLFYLLLTSIITTDLVNVWIFAPMIFLNIIQAENNKFQDISH
jgi:O-antigen ligase